MEVEAWVTDIIPVMSEVEEITDKGLIKEIEKDTHFRTTSGGYNNSRLLYRGSDNYI